MLGDFQLETSKGFDNYMYEIGVNWFTRKVSWDRTTFSRATSSYFLQIACTLYPTARNSITPDGRIKINTWSTFKSSELIFELNKPFQVRVNSVRLCTT